MLYNKLLENLILPLGDKVLGASFIRQLKKWRKIQYLPEVELQQLQNKNLREVLLNAVNNVPYFSDLNIPQKEDPYLWLQDFPVMTKDRIKKDPDQFIKGNKDQLIKYSSSGSSGVQGNVYLSKDEQSANRAIQILWWEWGGYKFGKPLLQTGITPERGLIKSIKDFLLRTTYIPAFEHDERSIKELLEKVEKRNGYFFGGYASSLYLLAQIAEQAGIKNVRFESAISWGDKMFPHYREAIEKRFNTRVFDTYGCGEGVMIASQCEEGNYHIMSPHVFLEIVDKNGNSVPDGEMGYVLVTRLDAFHMPIIRYYLGDLAVKSSRPPGCKCGRDLPFLDKVIGRDTDIVRTPSGKFMVVHFFTGIFEHISEIRQFRIIQEKIEGIKVEYIPEEGFKPETINVVEEKIRAYIKEPFDIEFTKVQNIPPTSSGKPQIIQSFLKKPKL